MVKRLEEGAALKDLQEEFHVARLTVVTAFGRAEVALSQWIKPKHTPEDLDALVPAMAERRSESATLRAVAKEFGTTMGSVTKAFARTGTDINPLGKLQKTPADMDALVPAMLKRRQEGVDSRTLAKEFRTGWEAIVAAFERTGADINDRGKSQKELQRVRELEALTPAVLRRHEEGASLRALAREFGVDRTVVTKMVAAA